MRLFTLLEEDGYVDLYRGDSSKVDQFLIGRTDPHALFGHGLYLTDSPRVAQDYVLKGARDEFYVTGKTPKDAVRQYIMKLAGDLPNKQEIRDAVMDEYWRSVGSRSPLSTASREQWEKIYQDKLKAAYKVQLNAAKEKFKLLAPTMSIHQNTLGEYVIRKNTTPGHTTVFHVPADYMAGVVDSEGPMPPKLLAIIQKLLDENGYGDTPLDLRGDNDKWHTFSDYVKLFPRMKFYYAWADRSVGGKGVGPDFDHFRNGTHSGMAFLGRDDIKHKLIEMCLAAGIVGFRYQGGVRISGDANRGGGGIRHAAYVFFDVEKMNSFIQRQDLMTGGEPALGLEKGMQGPRKL